MSRITSNIKREIKRIDDNLHAIKCIVKNRKNKDFINMCLEPLCITKIKPASDNVGKPAICYFDLDAVCGMFWYLRLVLEVVYFCDNMGFIPQIKWSKSLYYDESIKVTNNPFEYYFSQPFPLSAEELNRRPIIEYAPGKNELARKLIETGSLYEGDENYIDALAAVAKVALRYNTETKQKIDCFISEHDIDNMTLGVHVRGTDFKKKYEGHPVFVEIFEYFEYIDFALKTYGFSKIFLATDDKHLLEEFLNHYSNINVIYANEVNRGEGTTGIHTDAYINRKYSPYKEGLSALCDMASLAKCGGLISGVSNLPLVSRIMHKGEKNTYKYDKIINKGYVKNGISAAKETFSMYNDLRKVH